MYKFNSFQEYWDHYGSNGPNDKYWAKLAWNAAIWQATSICGKMEETYKDSAIVDKEVIDDLKTEIESLKSDN